eukprot:TRINITY_DN11913_c0_g1_i1.p1 TRINITY_DN11913_c0_g1~~TRINITY_DN11913_c0_g1_i1.p1  ORF type:complete len:373 (-),score=70.28 TRINITY_DN11913_c0_g1_i1:50-1060(-)
MASITLFVPCLYEWKQSNQEIRREYIQRSTILFLIFAGVSLGMHFGSWVWSLDLTSMAHSLVFATSSPVIIVVGLWVLSIKTKGGKRVWQYCCGTGDSAVDVASSTSTPKQKVILESPSYGETLGCFLGFIGLALMTLDFVLPSASSASSSASFSYSSSMSGSSSIPPSPPPSLAGDLLAGIGALTFVGYLVSGSVLRRTMPLFMYSFPVNLTSAIFLVATSLMAEDTSLITFGPTGVFGYFGSWQKLGWVLFLAMGPGLFGHTGINYVLKFISPVVVSIALMLEPIVGTFLGWMFGYAAIPTGAWTWVGSAMVIGSIVWVTFAAAKRREASSAMF